MREILFRAKRIDNGKWVEGYYQKRYDEIERERHYIFWCKSNIVWEYAEIDKNTICQYTGLHDKNDKKIYEGDIVALDSLGGFVVEYDNENARFIFNGEHKDKDYGHCGFHLYAQKEIEVIGNIYENADLTH